VKPPYVVPTMRDVEQVEPCGLDLVSTFSGSGASCLGFRLAGFTPRVACEFIPAARDTYAANWPTTPIEPRDVRQVAGDELRALAGLAGRDVHVLEGSPPCASFSLAGQRERLWGEVKDYSDTRQRVDDLFDEYARLVEELRPLVFVAENVKGLTVGAAKLYLRRIMRRLERAGYVVRAKVLDAADYGVPQRRARTILLGARADLEVVPSFPRRLGYRYSLDDAVRGTSWEHDARRLRYGPHYPFHDTAMYLHHLVNPSEPMPTILGAQNLHFYVGPPGRRNGERLSIELAKRLSTFPPDYVLTGSHARQWERIGRAVPPVFYAAVARHVRDTILRPALGIAA
jgi:DNA (cytosine-5)-methyltransferase 1